MKVQELTPSQFEELRQRYLFDRQNKVDGRCPSCGELADAGELVADKEIFIAYSGVDFCEEDFFCSAGDEEKSAGDDACSRFERGVRAFMRGRKSAADEDDLGRLLDEMPIGFQFLVNYVTTDSIGNLHSEKLSLQKASDNCWLAGEHWFFELGEEISAKVAKHSLIVSTAYRVRSVHTEMAEAGVGAR